MKIAVGFLVYNDTVKYLPFFLPSLAEALAVVEAEYEIYCLDNSEKELNENREYIVKSFPAIKYSFSGKNLGFSKGYNRLIKQALDFGAEYFLMINPDTILEKDSIVRMLLDIQTDSQIGAVAPRILKWDFVNNLKTDIIDCDGLAITPSHRFFDRHQGQRVSSFSSFSPSSSSSFSSSSLVFGFTGAAVLLRLSALRDIAFCSDNDSGHVEYLDELMFMYKEDADLSYRLNLAGWNIVFCVESVIYHDRTASPLGESIWQIIANRKRKSRLVKEWSFLNQWVLVLKYIFLPLPFLVKVRTWIYQLLGCAYALFFEPYLLKELKTLLLARKNISLKRQNMPVRGGVEKIVKMMENKGN